MVFIFLLFQTENTDFKGVFNKIIIRNNNIASHSVRILAFIYDEPRKLQKQFFNITVLDS